MIRPVTTNVPRPGKTVAACLLVPFTSNSPSLSTAMLGRSSADSPFWPGRAIVVGDSGPPEAREVLADAPHSELEPPSGSKPDSGD